MKKKKKIALIILVSILVAAMVGVSIWLVVVDVQSRDYNLIKIDVSDVPSPVTAAPVEHDVTLSQITMHYAVYGSGGHPLILIHGNGRDRTALAEAATYFANDYTVYAIDSRCHGKSTVTNEIDYDLMAADVAEFIGALGLEKPFVVGHSDGGITALAIAINYPNLLGGFIACGANSTPEMFKPYFTIGVKISYSIHHKILDNMMLTEPNFTKEQLNSITAPAYIVAGEFDIVKLKDTAFIADSIPNSRIAIIKWGNHSSYVSQDGKQIYALAQTFFPEILEQMGD